MEREKVQEQVSKEMGQLQASTARGTSRESGKKLGPQVMDRREGEGSRTSREAALSALASKEGDTLPAYTKSLDRRCQELRLTHLTAGWRSRSGRFELCGGGYRVSLPGRDERFSTGSTGSCKRPW
eukprot:752081-Hanusia_phi.AAC.2